MNSLALGHNAPWTRKNRYSIEIGASILQVAREGAKKTRIMYNANLSYGQLNRYLQLLTTSGLLAQHEERLQDDRKRNTLPETVQRL